MRIVYIPGVWDLLHVGHVAVLERARSLGDVLIVGVPSDLVVVEDKGAQPIIALLDRISMLRALRCVSMAVPYYALEFLTHLNQFRPDVLTVGETWGTESRHLGAEAWARQNHCRIVKLPYYRQESTTHIKQRVRKEWAD